MFDDANDAGPILSDEETGALLDAMREEEAARQVETRDADLANQEGPLRQALGKADRATGEIAQGTRAQLLRQIAIGLRVEPLPAEIVPREVIQSALDPAGATYALTEQDGAVSGFLGIDGRLASFVVVRSMGAAPVSEESAPAATPGKLSALDRKIIEELPKAIARATAKELLAGRPIQAVALPDGPETKGDERFEPMLRVGVRFHQGDTVAGEIIVALLAAGLAANTPPKTTSDVDARSTLMTHIRGVEVYLTAVLGRAHSTIRGLLALGAGDVLRLDAAPGDAVSLCVDEVVVAHGDPVVHRGDLAIQIRTPPGGEARP